MKKRNVKISLVILVMFFSCTRKELIYQVPRIVEERIVKDEDLEQIIAVLQTEEFEVYDTKKQIPKRVLKTLSQWQNRKIKFADQGECYRENDVVINPRIPNREIITILKSNNSFVMTYNHGGRGFHQHILFADLTKEEISDNIWIGNTTKTLGSKEQIIEELSSESNWLHKGIVCF